MQFHCLHPSILALNHLIVPARNKTEKEKFYEKIVQMWEFLKKNKVPEKEIQKIIGISRATYFRYKKALAERNFPTKKPKTFRKSKFGEDVKQKIFTIRKENPTYGKQKIAIILKRDFSMKISESSVGRILKTMKFPKSASAKRVKNARVFNKHSRPLQFKKYEEMKIGENVQFDHMTATTNGIVCKHFAAVERFSKSAYTDVFCNATSATARKFLEDFIETAPFNILSIQVDGGSEFMGEFEECCKKHKIPLFVLPPATPKYNGLVERSNRTFREEFYHNPAMTEYSIVGIRRELKKYLEKYNTYRPHASLRGLTPKEYLDLPPEKRPQLIVHRKRKHAQKLKQENGKI